MLGAGFDRTAVVHDRARDDVERSGTVAGIPERMYQLGPEVVDLEPCRLPVGHRRLEVMGKRLGAIFSTIRGQGGDPLCRAAMLEGASGARDLTVRRLPHDRVEEDVLPRPLDGRSTLATHELLALEQA